MRKIAIFALIFQLLFFPLEPVLAQEFMDEQVVEKQVAVEQTPPPHYPSLMRSVADIPADPVQAADSLSYLITAEKDRLDAEVVPFLRQHKYLKRLRSQLRSVNPDPSLWDAVVLKFTEWFSSEDTGSGQGGQAGSSPKANEVKIPRKPAVFGFPTADIPVRSLSDPVITPSPGQTVPQKLKDIIRIPQVNAIDDQFLPVYEDTIADNGEIVISSEIKQLAADLDYNPLSITNFVRNRTAFEPYYGAKKGSTGCLRERVCNDTDSASLTVALLRAAGIPARYKKGVSLFSVDQLKDLLGVQDTKAVYAVFAFNHVPIFTVSDNPDAGQNIEEADLSQETHLAIEWTHTEAFYDYDERGGDIPNTQDLSAIQNTDELRSLLRNEYKKQWIPIDTIIKPYTHTQEDILADTANFDTEAFWYGYFQYQGNLSPLEKYRQDILQATGRDIQDNQSTNTGQALSHSILPPTLPYLTGAGATPEGVNIQEETWSVLPDTRRQQVVLTLTKEDTQETILRHTFFASNINNTPLTLSYEGQTEQDKSIIEDRGGIHQTPTELVRIIPYLATDFATYRGIDNNAPDNQNNDPSLSIGEPLVLQFDYIVDNNSIHTDQKFSIAGNHEGIFITLSKIQDNPTFDNEEDQNRTSKILLEGNTAIAREYLKTVQKDGNILAQSLDYSYNIQFARAVVTQNRVLSEFDGIPTTFDFKGLSIDAGAYIADYSNRGDFKNHQKDFRLLWGQNASYQEGQTLTTLTGLNSIATTQGLQYAYANPNDYTVHRITQENEADIDNLNLSDNTKANLHTAIQNGNTVLTPDRPITLGNFTGILYVSLDPDWTGRYAIGEQVGNGGWTVDEVLLRVYIDQNRQEREGFLGQFGDSSFYFEDNRDIDSTRCTITNAEHNLITGRQDWSSVYGYPCMIEARAFHITDHSYILTSNGAYFFSPQLGYDYWVWRENVKAMLLADKNGEPQEQLRNVRLDGTFKFNPIAATYSWHGHYDGPYDDIKDKYRSVLTAYYQPLPDAMGNGIPVYGDILGKLQATHYNPTLLLCPANDPYCGKQNFVLFLLGYPIANRQPAAPSFADTNGQYQNFLGGQVYRKTTGKNRTQYVPGEIADFYNADENMVNGERGSGGRLGFPIADPHFVPGTNELLQKFEWRVVRYMLADGHADMVLYDDHNRRLNNKEYAKKILKDVMDGRISDAEAFARLADYIAYIAYDNEEFVRDFTKLLVGVDRILTVIHFKKVRKELYSSQQNFYQVGNDYGTGEVFSDTGFAFKYNDSHYILECRRNDIHTYNSNQLFHAMLGFNAGYFWPNWLADLATIAHDIKMNPLGEGASIEDVNLGFKTGVLGSQLRSLDVDKNQVGAWIREHIKDDAGSPPKSKRELEMLCKIRKHFRKFEKDNLDNEWGQWYYSEDIKLESGIYYQYYEKFGEHRNVKVMLDPRTEELGLVN